MKKNTFRRGLCVVLLFVVCCAGAVHGQTVSELRLAGAEPRIPETVWLRLVEDNAFTRVPPPAELQQAERRVATINVTYIGFSTEAQAAFQHAVDIWETMITTSIPINVEATWESLGAGILGGASADHEWLLTDGVDFFMACDALADSIEGRDIGGEDLGEPNDISASFNSDYATWYFGTDGNTPAGEIDFVSVVLRELGHGLGFFGDFQVIEGLGYYANLDPECGGPCPAIWDLFAENGAGDALTNQTLFPDASVALADVLQSEAVYVDGQLARNAAGGARPELYAPLVWEPGSSYSHLDEVVYPAGSANSLMTPFLNQAESIHDPGPIALCMFEDHGWITAETCEADLSVTKTDNRETVTAGDSTTYVITVSYTGPATISGVTVTDEFNSKLENVTWTCVASEGSSCTTSGNGDITDSATLAPDGLLTYTANATVRSSSGSTTLSNAVIAHPPIGITETNTANNAATDNTEIVGLSDLSIFKTDNQDSVEPDEAIIYQLVVSNAGPKGANPITVTDDLPDDLTSVTWTCVNPQPAIWNSSCTSSGTGDISDSAVNIPAGEAVHYFINATVAPTATGTVVNTATVTPPEERVDPDLSDNSSTDIDYVGSVADLSITKTDGQAMVDLGETLTYTIVVGNDGPVGVVGAKVVDQFPAIFESCSWTCVAMGGATCTAGPVATDIDDTVDLPIGGTLTYTAECLYNPAEEDGSPIVNTASVSSPIGTPDPDESNNEATDETLPALIFSDGFELGDTSRWSNG